MISELSDKMKRFKLKDEILSNYKICIQSSIMVSLMI